MSPEKSTIFAIVCAEVVTEWLVRWTEAGKIQNNYENNNDSIYKYYLYNNNNYILYYYKDNNDDYRCCYRKQGHRWAILLSTHVYFVLCYIS